MPITATRAILLGPVRDARRRRDRVDPVFGFQVPTPTVESNELLTPRDVVRHRAYDGQAKKLASMFRENFSKFAADVDSAVAAAGPRPA